MPSNTVLRWKYEAKKMRGSVRALVNMLPALSFSAACRSGSCPATEAGASIWTDDATTCIEKVIFDGSDGAGPAPEGSECHTTGIFSISVASRRFEWNACSSPNGYYGPHEIEQEQRTLSVSEFDAVALSLRNVTVAEDAEMCGSDKGLFALVVETADGAQIYADSFYQCSQYEGPFFDVLYVDAIDGAFEAVKSLRR